MIDDPPAGRVGLRELMLEHRDSLLRFLRTKGVSEDDAQDLAQETYLRAFVRGAAASVVESSPALPERSYLFKIAQNLFLDRVRRGAVRRRAADGVGAHRELAHILAAPSPHRALAAKQDLETVRAALHDMDDRQRQVFVLRRFSGLRYGQIAAHLGVSERTVERHMKSALRCIREALEDSSEQHGGAVGSGRT